LARNPKWRIFTKSDGKMWSRKRLETADELDRVQCHRFGAVVIFGIPPTKTDATLFKAQQSSIGDGHTDNLISQHGVLAKGSKFIQEPFNPEELARKVRAVPELMMRLGRILVVDDQAEVRAFLLVTLEQAGYEMVEAADGKHALNEVLEGRVDLVITDLVVPEQEGIETIKSLRKDAPGPPGHRIHSCTGKKNGA
jgi:PleD family two-component response regulator